MLWLSVPSNTRPVLGSAKRRGEVPEAVDSYLKAEDASDYLEVIQASGTSPTPPIFNSPLGRKRKPVVTNQQKQSLRSMGLTLGCSTSGSWGYPNLPWEWFFQELPGVLVGDMARICH